MVASGKWQECNAKWHNGRVVVLLYALLHAFKLSSLHGHACLLCRHLPVGVLYDLSGQTNSDEPWEIKVHTQVSNSHLPSTG